MSDAQPKEKSFADSCRAMAAIARADPNNANLLAAAHLLDEAALECERNEDVRDVQHFARRMTAKMLRKSYEGHAGWRAMCQAQLWDLLIDEISVQRDPVNIANYAMMLAHAQETRAPADSGGMADPDASATGSIAEHLA